MNESAVAAKQNDISLVESLIHLLVLLSLKNHAHLRGYSTNDIVIFVFYEQTNKCNETCVDITFRSF